MATSVRVVDASAELTRLDRRERAISRRRRVLHQQIDRLYLAAPLDDVDIARLDRLEAFERETSLERHRLHRAIDELRACMGLAPWRSGEDLDDAA